MSASIAAGGQSMASLELLANPTALQERIDQLKQAEESANEVLALVGPANEILSMREDIENLKQAAQDALDQAQADADSIVDKAEQDAALIKDRAQAEAAQTVEQANAVAKDAEGRRAKAAENVAVVERELTAIRTREGELDEQAAALQQKAEELTSQAASLQGERARLVAARDAINAAL